MIDALYKESVQVIVLADEMPTKLLKLTPKERASPFDEVSKEELLQLNGNVFILNYFSIGGDG